MLIVFLFYNTYNRFDYITSCENEAKVRKWALQISSYIKNLIPKHRIHLSSLFEFVLQSVYSTFANMTFLPIPRISNWIKNWIRNTVGGLSIPGFLKSLPERKTGFQAPDMGSQEFTIIVTPNGCISKYPKITAWMYRCLP